MNSTSRPRALIPTEQISYPPWPSLSLPSRSLVGSLNQALFHLPPGAALLEMPQRLSTSCRSQRSMSWSQLTSPLSTLHLAPVFLSRVGFSSSPGFLILTLPRRPHQVLRLLVPSICRRVLNPHPRLRPLCPASDLWNLLTAWPLHLCVHDVPPVKGSSG